MSRGNELLSSLPDTVSLDPTAAKELFSTILGHRRWNEEICSREVAEAVWSMWMEAVQQGLQGAQALLCAYPLMPEGLRSSVCTQFQMYGDSLRIILSSIRFEHPLLVDSEWIVLRGRESGSLGQVDAPLCEVKLTALACGETSSRSLSKISLNSSQLQDLLWTLKEAQNGMKRLAEGT